MIFSIDHRENRIKLAFPDAIHTILPMGDFHFQENEYELLVERKTWHDLHQSIRDGRFREQRSRLLEWRSSCQKFMYWIEGSFPKEMTTEYSTSLRLMVGYDIPVLFFTSIEETIDYLKYLLCQNNLTALFRTRSTEQDQLASRTRTMKKKNYMDSKLFLMETLCQIRGVSHGMVEALLGEEICTLEDFYTKKESLLHRLKHVTYTTPKGHEKKLPKQVQEKIRVNFFT